MLRDEGISGPEVSSVLEAIGRGAMKASEIACRLRAARTNLSPLLQRLFGCFRAKPGKTFGNKPACRQEQSLYNPGPRAAFLVSGVLATSNAPAALRPCGNTPSAARTRRDGIGGFLPPAPSRCRALLVGREATVVVTEVKWYGLSVQEHGEMGRRMVVNWQRCVLRNRFRDVRFEALDTTFLKRLGDCIMMIQSLKCVDEIQKTPVGGQADKHAQAICGGCRHRWPAGW